MIQFATWTEWQATSLADYQNLVKKHVRRVQTLGTHLFSAHPQIFPDLSYSKVEEFLTLHDVSKLVNPEEAFERSRIRLPDGLIGIGSETGQFAERLFAHFGKSTPEVERDQNSHLRVLVEELNLLDRRVAMIYFEQNGMTEMDGSLDARARQLLLIERVADVVDRGESPASKVEFNREMVKASEWLKDDLARQLATHLERQYHELTSFHLVQSSENVAASVAKSV